MSIAVAEVLLADDNPTQEDFLAAFFRCFKRDPRDGYSRGFQSLLEKATSPKHLQELLIPNSDKNGACMRAVPIGVLPDPLRVVEVAARQAKVTHATEGGIESAIAVALMSHWHLHLPPSSLANFCCTHLPSFDQFLDPWEGPVQKTERRNDLGMGMLTAWAVYNLLEQSTSMLDILRHVITWGGDTDSVAAIAWGIASSRYGGPSPTSWLHDDLERCRGQVWGSDFLKGLGSKLMDRYGGKEDCLQQRVHDFLFLCGIPPEVRTSEEVAEYQQLYEFLRQRSVPVVELEVWPHV